MVLGLGAGFAVEVALTGAPALEGETMGYTTRRILHTNKQQLRVGKKQLRVQRQIAADTALQVQMQAAQLELQKQQALTAERHRLEALAATHVAEGP
ncbi:hypothetical protein ACLMMA_04040 [Micrococcus luteus]